MHTHTHTHARACAHGPANEEEIHTWPEERENRQGRHQRKKTACLCFTKRDSSKDGIFLKSKTAPTTGYFQRARQLQRGDVLKKQGSSNDGIFSNRALDNPEVATLSLRHKIFKRVGFVTRAHGWGRRRGVADLAGPSEPDNIVRLRPSPPSAFSACAPPKKAHPETLFSWFSPFFLFLITCLAWVWTRERGKGKVDESRVQGHAQPCLGVCQFMCMR